MTSSDRLQLILHLLRVSERQTLRDLYWDMRAQDIHEKWGHGHADHPTLRAVVAKTGARRILDVGCGSGRLFPVLLEVDPELLVGQDVSRTALQLAAQRSPEDPRVQLIREDLSRLSFPPEYFDLVICSRVLAAIPRERISDAIQQIARLGRYAYLNEMSDSDASGATEYWFVHDYERLMAEAGMALVEQGTIGQQSWSLFRRSIREAA